MPSIGLADLASLNRIEVSCGGRMVGTLARPETGGITYFEYAESWVAGGFSISPLSLPLERRLFRTDGSEADELFGIFCDSLPDDWGRLLVDRALMDEGIDASSLSALSRLALVGQSGLGALEYGPSPSTSGIRHEQDFDALARECQVLLDDGKSDFIAELFNLGSSSGGARPKVMVELDGEPWIVKFPTSLDGIDSGADEYRYALAAQDCGITMAEVRLIPSASCAGFFATRRFDRRRDAEGNLMKVHMASAAALLEASPFDALDYRDLMRLLLALRCDVHDVEQLYRVMCFNVFADNCDDHARNFSFLYDEESASWHLSPAYDLTRNPGFLGEHSTLVNGRGSQIEVDDLIAAGEAGGMSVRRARTLAREVREAIDAHL